MKIITIILLLLLSQAVHAIDINIIRGYEKPVCRAAQTMLHGIDSRSQLRDLQWKSPGYYPDSKITLPQWKQGTIYVIKNRPFQIQYAYIDINNDEKDELVFLKGSMLRYQEYTDIYVIDRSNIDFKKPVKFTNEELQDGIIRKATSQFDHLGVSLASLLLFQFETQTYVFVFDLMQREQYGIRFPILVIQYLDSKIVLFHNVYHGSTYTNDYNLVCVLDR